MKSKLLIVALASAACSAVMAAPVHVESSQPNANTSVFERNDGIAVDSAIWAPVQYERDRRDERDRRGRGRGGGPDAVLFSNPDLRGQRFVIDGDYLPDLANTGFNDRAQSLHIGRGYWIFCSDAQFQGRCRTFGPGDYPQLGWALDNKVSSGRRISNHYPYSGRPNWSDRR